MYENLGTIALVANANLVTVDFADTAYVTDTYVGFIMRVQIYC